MNLKKELEQRAKAGLRRIKINLYRFGMIAMVPIGRIRHASPGIAHAGRDHSRKLTDQVLHTPETAASENRSFSRHYITPLVGRHMLFQFQANVFGIFIISQRYELCMPKMMALGSFRKLNLSDQLR